MKVRQNLNVRLVVLTRLRLRIVEYNVKELTMILQMSKGSPKTTLGDLQGDQSEVQLSKSPSFIVNQGGVNDQRRYAWLCIIMTSYR
jgi:hypothetical protein